MILENVELHSVVELEDMPGVPGRVMRRVPRAVRQKLNPNARITSAMASGCEVRFVSDYDAHRIRLFSSDDSEVLIFCGDFFHSRHALPAGVVKTIQVQTPERFGNVKPQMLNRNFNCNVWRYAFGRTEAAFLGVDPLGGMIRPPTAAEKPKMRWLAYGSSITHNVPETGYPQVAAKMLGADVYNLGQSGACHIEPEMVDFFASRNDFDIFTAEVGVNMRGSFTPEAFRNRVAYLIDRMVESHPTKPLALITHFPTSQSYHIEPDVTAQTQAAFDNATRELVAAKKHKQLHLIEGETILDRFDLQSVDLLHPTVLGQMRMGTNLAARLSEIVS